MTKGSRQSLGPGALRLGGFAAIVLALVAAALAALPEERPVEAAGEAEREPALVLPKPVTPKALSDYSALLERGVFTPQVKPERRSKAAVSLAVAAGSPGALPPADPGAIAFEIRPAGGAGLQSRRQLPWIYVGAVSIDGRLFALLENPRTGESGYFRAGDPLGDARVMRVSRQSIVIEDDGGTHTLALTSGDQAAPAQPKTGAGERSEPGAASQPAQVDNSLTPNSLILAAPAPEAR